MKPFYFQYGDDISLLAAGDIDLGGEGVDQLGVVAIEEDARMAEVAHVLFALHFDVIAKEDE